MRVEKLRVYLLEIILIIFLFFILFASNIVSKMELAVLLIVYYLILIYFLKKKDKKSIFEKKTFLLMTIFGLVYLAIFYAIGLYVGFEKNKYIFNLKNVVNVFLPIAVIIVVSELIRKRYLSQEVKVLIKGRRVDFSSFLVFVIMTLIDLAIYNGMYNLNRLDDFLLVLGFVFFSSLSCNLLFNYLSNRYGPKGVISFRLITILSLYVLPIIPRLYILMRTFLRILFPLILYFVFESIYAKENYATGIENRRKNLFFTAVVFIILTLFIMLISCQFRFGIIVIGSNSMTGTINKGDAIIYEKYEDQQLYKGDIIIFNYNGIKTVHRIVEVRNINGTLGFITKGDANASRDTEFRSQNDVIGLVKLKIKYIGLPTIWLRSLFQN